MKHYACEKVRVPYEIIESGLHSYVTDSESGRGFDYRSDIINNSLLIPEMRNLRESSNLSKLFNNNFFKSDILGGILQTGESKSDSMMLLRIIMLLSANLQDG